MSNILVVAPHPDDETLGLGGTIIKNIEKGNCVYWLVVTGMTELSGYSKQQINQRDRDIEKIADYYNFEKVFQLRFPAAQLNYGVLGNLIKQVGQVVKEIEPEEIFLPYPKDIHSDHFFVFEAMKATSKWFRYPYVKRILCYETLSETNFCLSAVSGSTFIPNVYEDITPYFKGKLEAMNIYASEISSHPFPRSEDSLVAQAKLRGSECGCSFAEAFMLLKEIRCE